jgi:hypothetical protein
MVMASAFRKLLAAYSEEECNLGHVGQKSGTTTRSQECGLIYEFEIDAMATMADNVCDLQSKSPQRSLSYGLLSVTKYI